VFGNGSDIVALKLWHSTVGAKVTVEGVKVLYNFSFTGEFDLELGDLDLADATVVLDGTCDVKLTTRVARPRTVLVPLTLTLDEEATLARGFADLEHCMEWYDAVPVGQVDTSTHRLYCAGSGAGSGSERPELRLRGPVTPEEAAGGKGDLVKTESNDSKLVPAIVVFAVLAVGVAVAFGAWFIHDRRQRAPSR
jgi:hypothetical protein